MIRFVHDDFQHPQYALQVVPDEPKHTALPL